MLAQETGESYLEAAQAKGIELELISADDESRVKGEAELLSQAIGNLIDNAIRYRPQAVAS